ncbi:cyclase family protein [Haliea sp. E17]|uniref:cyclase family protein n=1 Tax=Haliea sp. E17 TaxID=3401576 RepID=UPI003AAF6F03
MPRFPVLRHTAAAVLTCACAGLAQAEGWPAGRIVDMSWPYNAETIYWPTEKGFEKSTRFEGMTDKGYYYSAYSVKTAEHGGTHLDAPIHFAAGRHTTDQVPLEQLMGPAVVVDVSAKARGNNDYLVSVADIEAWEKQHGAIPAGAIVLLRTGHGPLWPDREAYLGTAALGEAAVPLLHFPGLAPDAATLLESRAVDAVGIDTASIDYGQSQDFMAHRILLGANIPVFENVANLEQLPATGALVIALPMKIEGGSGAPLRIAGIIPAP